MRYFLFFLILIVVSEKIAAQQPYKWTQLQGPNIGDGVPIVWGNNDEIIAVKSNGYYFTENEGKTWDFRSFTKGPFKGSIYNKRIAISPDGEYFYFVYSNSDADSDYVGLYRSTDRGNSWAHKLKNINISQLTFGTDGSYYITSPSYVYRSIDKGNSWVQLENTQNFSIIASNEKYIFYIAFNNTNYYYYYSLFSLETNTSETFDLQLPANLRGTIMLENGTILAYSDSIIASSDGSAPWKTISNFSGIQSIAKTKDNRLIALVISGLSKRFIAESTNNGISWDSIATLAYLPPTTSYTLNLENPDKILFENTPEFYLATALCISKDKGKSWKEIGFRSAQVGKVIVMENSKILASSYLARMSTDNGDSWKPINQYYFEKGPGGFAIGINSDTISILDSSASAQWRKQSVIKSLSSALVNPQIAADSKYIYISNGNTIYRSDDTAFSWMEVNIPNSGNPISCLAASSDGTIYFGTSPIMFRSDDHGATWIKLIPVHEILTLNCLKTFGDKEVLLGTQGKGLLISIDKGNSWTRSDGNNFDSVYYVAIDSKGSIAASTEKGLWIYDVLKKTWEKQIINGDPNLGIGGVDVSKNDEFYVGTYGASMWVGTTNYNAAPYSNISTSGIKLFPNPASDKVWLMLQLPKEDIVTLKFYDMLGRNLDVFSTEKFSGEQTIELSTANLPNGIYTLQLNGDKNNAQKLLVNH